MTSKETSNFNLTQLATDSTKYKELFEVLPSAVYTCDLNGFVNYCNEAAIELWGRKPEIGKDLWCGSWKIYTENGEEIDPNDCPMAITLKEKRAVHCEAIVIERPDNTRRNVLPHPRPLFDEQGQLIGAVNILVDITENKKKEELLKETEMNYRLLSETLQKKVDERTLELRKNEEQYHKMIEEVQDYAILLLNNDGTILNWNKGAEKIKGYHESEIVGKNFRIFYRECDKIDMLPDRLINEARTTGRAMDEGWRVRKDGTQFWGSIVITALHNEKNEVFGFSKLTRDLSERKIAEDQLREYASDIEFQNKQLEEFAYVASHDLQEPLRKIQVFTDLLEKNFGDKESSLVFLDKIKNCSGRMLNLISDVLRYSQLSKGDELIQEIDLNKVIEVIREDFELLIQEKNVSLVVDELPKINGIHIQLHQLFYNLISNSIKFCNRDPEIKISCKTATLEEIENAGADPEIKYIKINFQDNGIGFEQKHEDRIFKMFQRLSNYNGTGIGLALCKKIVENHSGWIQVTSEIDRGTCFHVFLPTSLEEREQG